MFFKLLSRGPAGHPASQSLLRDAAFGATFGPMTHAAESRLLEALKRVDLHGDIAPAYVQDPMTIALRQTAIQGDLMRWDDSRGHYVLTGTGRNRIAQRNRAPGSVVRFRRRDDSETPPKTQRAGD